VLLVVHHVINSPYNCLSIAYYQTSRFHNISNHSPKVQTFGIQLDYLGILVLMWGSTIPSIYYGFYCDPGIFIAMAGSVCDCTRRRTLTWQCQIPSDQGIVCQSHRQNSLIHTSVEMADWPIKVNFPTNSLGFLSAYILGIMTIPSRSFGHSFSRQGNALWLLLSSSKTSRSSRESEGYCCPGTRESTMAGLLLCQQTALPLIDAGMVVPNRKSSSSSDLHYQHRAPGVLAKCLDRSVPIGRFPKPAETRRKSLGEQCRCRAERKSLSCCICRETSGCLGKE